jgi:opacity protein-like surface antigen
VKAINPRLRLGGELIGVSESAHEQRFNTTLMVQYFPVGALGLYGKAGAGLASVDVLVEESDGSRALTDESAVGLTLGAGWEIPVFGIAVNAALDAMYQTEGGIKDALGNSSVHWVLLASIGIIFP